MSEIQSNQQPGEKYKNVNRSLGKMLFYNFIGGIAWGLGILVGTTIVFAIIAFFIKNIDWVPILGRFLADILKAAQESSLTPIPPSISP